MIFSNAHGLYCLSISELDEHSKDLVNSGIRATTQKTYNSAQKSYLEFCNLYHLIPLPATEQIILWYIAYLNLKKLSPSTVHVYLSALRSLHVMSDLAPPDIFTPKVKLSLKSIAEASPPPVQKHPITYSLLSNMFKLVPMCLDGQMYRAALALGFFAALRSHEYLVSELDSNSTALLLSHVSFAVNDGLKCMTLQIPKSKTTPHGFTVTVGCSLTEVCAVCCLKEYLKSRYLFTPCKLSQNMFVNSQGTALTKLVFNEYIKKLVARLGLFPSLYSAHSLRAGATTTAATLSQPFQDWELQVLGNWRSDTYKRYVRNFDTHTVKFSQRLTNQSGLKLS